MNTTPILAKLGAITAAIAVPAMLFLGAGSATAQDMPVCQDCTPISSTVGSVPSALHPDFDWRPTAPAARPGSPRTAPATTSTPNNRTGTAGFEPESF
jgi:hypothetical protein